MAGIFVATLVNHGPASSLGSWISSNVPRHVLAHILAATFIGFGPWTPRPDTLEEAKGPERFGAFATTVALAAQFKSVALVTIGTTWGMLAADGLAVFLRERLAAKVQMKWVRCAEDFGRHRIVVEKGSKVRVCGYPS